MAEKEKPAGAEELNRKGLMALEAGQYDYAVSMFRKILAINPESHEAAEGIKAAKTRKLQKAGRVMQKIRKPVYILQASIYRKLKQHEKSLDKYESLFAMPDPPYRLLAPLADIYLEKNMVERAIGAYKAVLQSDINNVHCLVKLGKIYCRRGNMEEAKRIYDHLASIAPSDESVMKEVKDAYALFTIDRGRWDEESSFRKKIKTGAPDEARPGRGAQPPEASRRETGIKISLLEGRLGKNPDDASARKELAENLSAARRNDEAVFHYKKLLEGDENNINILMEIGNIYIREGEFDKAVKVAERLHSLAPENRSALYTLAGLYLKQDAPLKAIEAYAKLSGMEPRNPKIREKLGALYEQNRFFEKAIAEYENVLAIEPGRTGIEQKIGSLYLREGKLAEAAKRFDKALSSDPGNIGLRAQLADLYRQNNELEKAEEEYMKILEKEPGNTAVLKKLEAMSSSKKQKRLRELRARTERIREILNAEPRNEAVQKELKEIRDERIEINICLLEEELKSDPEQTKTRFELGKLYMEKGETDRAIKEFQRIPAGSEAGMESLHMLGLCFESKNMLDIAARQLEKAEKGAPENSELKKAVLYDLGRIYEKTGKGEKAVEKYKQIYETDISYKDVGEKIERAYGG